VWKSNFGFHKRKKPNRTFWIAFSKEVAIVNCSQQIKASYIFVIPPETHNKLPLSWSATVFHAKVHPRMSLQWALHLKSERFRAELFWLCWQLLPRTKCHYWPSAILAAVVSIFRAFPPVCRVNPESRPSSDAPCSAGSFGSAMAVLTSLETNEAAAPPLPHCFQTYSKIISTFAFRGGNGIRRWVFRLNPCVLRITNRTQLRCSVYVQWGRASDFSFAPALWQWARTWSGLSMPREWEPRTESGPAHIGCTQWLLFAWCRLACSAATTDTLKRTSFVCTLLLYNVHGASLCWRSSPAPVLPLLLLLLRWAVHQQLVGSFEGQWCSTRKKHPLNWTIR